jgi:hypothetical protein
MKEVMVSSKLDAITLEYNYLLTTQLDSQRQYFEGLMAQQEAKQRQALAAAQVKADAEGAQRAAAQAAAKEAERRRQQMERKLVSRNTHTHTHTHTHKHTVALCMQYTRSCSAYNHAQCYCLQSW